MLLCTTFSNLSLGNNYIRNIISYSFILTNLYLSLIESSALLLSDVFHIDSF